MSQNARPTVKVPATKTPMTSAKPFGERERYGRRTVAKIGSSPESAGTAFALATDMALSIEKRVRKSRERRMGNGRGA